MSPLLAAREVTRDSLGALLDIEVRPDQRDQVASPPRTIAQVAYEPGAIVRGLWCGPRAVGLLAMIDQIAAPDAEAPPGHAYLWRLTIASDAQGQGFGRAAVGLAAGIGRGWGAQGLVLFALEKEGGAIPFYLRLGFRPTGRRAGREMELSRPFD